MVSSTCSIRGACCYTASPMDADDSPSAEASEMQDLTQVVQGIDVDNPANDVNASQMTDAAGNKVEYQHPEREQK